jgi:hypothetical protein
MPKIIDTEENINKFFCFKTALEQLQSEKLKCEILKP